MVTDMKLKALIPALLALALTGCAATGPATNDLVRTRVQSELAQARADGSLPLTEAQYIYPNWAAARKAP